MLRTKKVRADGLTDGWTGQLLYAILRMHRKIDYQSQEDLDNFNFKHNQVVIRISYKSITIGNIKCEVTVYHVITFTFYQRNRFKACKPDFGQFSKY